ncbi:MAG: FGGY family carbohydrate kinase [Acholeplasmataceae bacterium]|nr:FGGY family carbohydrate kinase [Acholeplasmataceae bacterium]
MKKIVVVDVGTQSLRAIVYNTQGEQLFVSQLQYSPMFNGIEVEQDPRTFKDSLYGTLKEVANFAKQNQIEIGQIAVTSQRASIIPIDKNGKVLHNAITWQDRRSYEETDRVTKKMSMQDIYHKTGLRLDSYFSAPKMMWLKRNRPEIYEATHKIIGVQDYVVYLLTNRFVTDSTQAARTLLMNINTFQWDDELLDAFELDKKLLCDIVKPGSIVGTLGDQLVEKTGLSKSIEVITAGGDQQCAAVGLNVLRPGTLEANIGTGSFIIAYSEKPAFDENMRILCSASAVADQWIVEAGLLTSGAIYTWYKDNFYKNGSGPIDYDLINQEVTEAQAGSNGLVFVPHFKGSAAPYWNPLSKGVFFNAMFDHKRGDFARSILEGIAMEMAQNIELIENTVGYVDIIHAAGGLTKFPTFNQIQADIFNKAVSVYSSAEATALGALITTLVTLKKYKTHADAFEALLGKAEKKTYHANAKNIYTYKKLLRTKKLLYQALNDSQIYNYMTMK